MKMTYSVWLFEAGKLNFRGNEQYRKVGDYTDYNKASEAHMKALLAAPAGSKVKFIATK